MEVGRIWLLNYSISQLSNWVIILFFSIFYVLIQFYLISFYFIILFYFFILFYFIFHFWHKRSALQSVAVRRSTGNSDSGHYFHRYFLSFFSSFFSSSFWVITMRMKMQRWCQRGERDGFPGALGVYFRSRGSGRQPGLTTIAKRLFIEWGGDESGWYADSDDEDNLSKLPKNLQRIVECVNLLWISCFDQFFWFWI